MPNILQPKHYARIREVQKMDEPTWRIEKWLRARKGPVSKSSITSAFQTIRKHERERVLSALEKQGRIKMVKNGGQGKKQVTFYEYIHQ